MKRGEKRELSHSFHGIPGYAKVVGMLPATSKQIADRLGAWEVTVAKLMRGLHRVGVVHRCAVIYSGPKRTAGSVWAFGRGVDVPLLRNVPPRHRAPGAHAIAFGSLIRALYGAPQSVSQLVEVTGLNKGTVLRVVRQLRKDGRIYVAEWRQRTGSPIQAWAIGANMPDAARPTPKRAKPRPEQERAAA